MTATATERRKLGRSGPDVFPIALGCMGMSGEYCAADDAESLGALTVGFSADELAAIEDSGSGRGGGGKPLR